MKKIAIALATAAALVSAPGLQAKEKPAGEEKLAKMLEGRVAGEPVDCISLHASHNATVIDKTAIVYRSGGVLYVNRPTNADQLDRNEIMVTNLHIPRLCKLDTVRLHDRSGHWFRGFVGLQEFVPYRKVAEND